METLGWTLYLPRLLENCFLFLVFFVFLVLPVFFCFGQKPWKKMETLGWTLYLPRLLENCFLFLVFFVFLVLPVFFVLVKNLGKNGDSWVDPLSPKIFWKLFSFSCFFCFFGSSSFFLFWSKTLEKNGDSWVDPLSPKTFRKLFSFSCFFWFFQFFFFWSKTLEKNGDSWVDPLSPKTFRKLFFLFWSLSASQKKRETRLFGRGGPSPDSQNIVFHMFFQRFFLRFRSVYRIRRDQLSYSASRTPSHL